MKKLIIHDGDAAFEEKLKAQLPDAENFIIVGETSPIHACVGCFACWVKTPTKCVLKDEFNNMASLYKECDEMIIVSECCYGMYSPFVKNVQDRTISFMLPYFRKVGGEMHHRKRYENTLDMQVHYYGDVTDAEKETARKLAERNSLNFFGKVNSVSFWDSIDDVKLNV